MMMRTAMELKGIPCAGLEDTQPKQSILASKSFSQMQTDIVCLAQALSHHCARAVEKLRQGRLVAKRLYVFVHTNGYRFDLAQHCQSIEVQFINPTDDIRLITRHAKRCLQTIFRPGHYYKKVGIGLEELMPNESRQLDMFHQPSKASLEKTERLMSVIDAVNQKYGRSTLCLAAEGHQKPWLMRAALKSPAYTTRWSELPIARL